MRTAARPLAVLALAVGLVASGCGRTDGSAAGESAGRSTTSTTAATSTTDAAPGTGCPGAGDELDRGPYAVGRQLLRFEDTSRPTKDVPARGMAASDRRTLPVAVLYPAVGEAGAEVADDAPPAEGRFPLVVYSHGVSSSGMERHAAISRWAAAGYVVIAPTFPLSSSPTGDVSDLVNQPADVEFVTEQFRAGLEDTEARLHDRVRTDCVALAGHSLGAATTLAAAFDPCCGNLDPAAVIDIAGLGISVTPGADLGAADPLPVLIVHGQKDAVVPYAQGDALFGQLRGPRWFVTIPEGQHSSMFEPPEVEVLTDAVVAFLDAQLKGTSGELDQLPDTIAASGMATLRTAPAG